MTDISRIYVFWENFYMISARLLRRTMWLNIDIDINAAMNDD